MPKLRATVLAAVCALAVSAVFSIPSLRLFAGAFPASADPYEAAESVPRAVPKQPDDITYRLPIIMYHSVNKKNSGAYNVLPEQLEKDLLYIKENNLTPVHVSQLIDFKESGRPLPPRPVMITFDDAALSLYLYGWPLLQKHGVKFVIAPIGRHTDANYDAAGKIIPRMRSHMNWEQLKECYDSGLAEIQNHSYDLHRRNNGRDGMKKRRYEDFESYRRALAADVNKMRDLIREKTGAECTAVAYPFGAHTLASEKVLSGEGYKAAFTCYEKVNRINRDTNLFNLCRFNRSGGLTTKSFFEKRLKISEA